MIIILNGPLRIGKSTLAEALAENIDQCVMLDGDHLVAANPPSNDKLEHLHSTITLLIEHHQRFGYRHFIIDHLWTTPAELDDLRNRLTEFDTEICCFLLTLHQDEILRRIERHSSARAIDALDSDRRTCAEECEALAKYLGDELGERFDVSAPVEDIVGRMLRPLVLR